MGVSGCGKTTMGQALAQLMRVPFIEGDDLHSTRNVALMAAGTPLTDEDRAGWLDAVGQALQSHPHGAVASCSALRRRYRDRLRQQVNDLRFVHLHGDAQTLALRLQQRQHAYMPASLLTSQLATLELPDPDEHVVSLGLDRCAAELAQLAHQALQHPSH